MLKWLNIPAREPETPQAYFARLPVIETERLMLRRLTMRDAKDLFAWMRDPEVARNVLWQAHQDVWETRSYLRYMIWQYREGMPGSWGVVEKESGRVVGTIGFMAYQADHGVAEVGYSLSRDCWNRGYMTEALMAVLAECFHKLKLNRVEAMHFRENPASGRVMEKCGMRHEGTLRGRVTRLGEVRDVEMWGVTRKDWDKLHRA